MWDLSPRGHSKCFNFYKALRTVAGMWQTPNASIGQINQMARLNPRSNPKRQVLLLSTMMDEDTQSPERLKHMPHMPIMSLSPPDPQHDSGGYAAPSTKPQTLCSPSYPHWDPSCAVVKDSWALPWTSRSTISRGARVRQEPDSRRVLQGIFTHSRAVSHHV